MLTSRVSTPSTTKRFPSTEQYISPLGTGAVRNQVQPEQRYLRNLKGVLPCLSDSLLTSIDLPWLVVQTWYLKSLFACLWGQVFLIFVFRQHLVLFVLFCFGAWLCLGLILYAVCKTRPFLLCYRNFSCPRSSSWWIVKQKVYYKS